MIETNHPGINRIVFCYKIGMHPIRLKIPKTEVITAEPPYHAQVWEYPPQARGSGHSLATAIHSDFCSDITNGRNIDFVGRELWDSESHGLHDDESWH